MYNWSLKPGEQMLLFRSKTFSSLININWRAIVTAKAADPYFLTGGAMKWGSFPWRCLWKHWAAGGCSQTTEYCITTCGSDGRNRIGNHSVEYFHVVLYILQLVKKKKKKWRLSSYALLNVIFHWGHISVDSSLSANAVTGRRRQTPLGEFCPKGIGDRAHLAAGARRQHTSPHHEAVCKVTE